MNSVTLAAGVVAVSLGSFAAFGGRPKPAFNGAAPLGFALAAAVAVFGGAAAYAQPAMLGFGAVALGLSFAIGFGLIKARGVRSYILGGGGAFAPAIWAFDLGRAMASPTVAMAIGGTVSALVAVTVAAAAASALSVDEDTPWLTALAGAISGSALGSLAGLSSV